MEKLIAGNYREYVQGIEGLRVGFPWIDIPQRNSGIIRHGYGRALSFYILL